MKGLQNSGLHFHQNSVSITCLTLAHYFPLMAAVLPLLYFKLSVEQFPFHYPKEELCHTPITVFIEGLVITPHKYCTSLETTLG